MPKKISIVTPSLNQAKFVEDPIKSVINQEGDFELEYIVMDGGSTDNTVDILKKYDELINNGDFRPNCKKLVFRWFSEMDRGQSHAINKGFKMASGEIVNWLCSDDFLESGALQNVKEFFERNASAKIVFGDSYEVGEGGEIKRLRKGREFSFSELVRRGDIAQKKFFVSQPSVFFKKEILDELGYVDEDNQFSMDYELWLRFRKKYKFHYIDRVLSSYTNHAGMKSRVFMDKQFKESINASRKYWDNWKYPFSYYSYLPLRKIYLFLRDFLGIPDRFLRRV